MGFFGMLFGAIDVETPDHVIVHKTTDYQVWRYPSSVVACVYAKDLPLNPNGEAISDSEFSKAAFPLLARYIGVFRDPENKKQQNTNGEDGTGEKMDMTAPVIMEGEKMAMTAPVIVEGEKMAMTAPVIMEGQEEKEKVEMTAPVIMSNEQNGNESGSKGQSMKFLLPSKYTSIDQAPIPTNCNVKLEMIEGGRCDAVVSFSGFFNMDNFSEKAEQFLKILEKDNLKVIGQWNYQGYNPPFTLPWCRRNEIHIPVDPEPYADIDGSPKED